MKKLPEKITLFINWEDQFVTADACEAIDRLKEDDDIYMSFLDEYHPDWTDKDEEDEDLSEQYYDEFVIYCTDILEEERNGWEIKEVDFPY
jgi:hypothetical protein